MRFLRIVLTLLFAVTALAWSAEDYEIFEITEQLQHDMGQDTNFYSFLGVEKGPDASFDEISAAYKKRSRQFHPDKVKKKAGMSNSQFKKAKKQMSEKYEKLSVVGAILRGPRKERYDFFLKNGFPKWKGTGYYYSKFRPGFLSVIIGLFIAASVFHYVAISINTTQNRKRVENLVAELKKSAWGESGVPPQDMSDRRVFNPNMKKNFIVKFDGSVYLVEEPKQVQEDGDGITYGTDGKGNIVYYDEEEQARRRKRAAANRSRQNETLLPLNPDEIHDPTYRDSLPVRLGLFLWNSSVGKYVPSVRINLAAPVSKAIPKEDKPAKKPVKRKGVRKELPNGKVVYSRKR